MKPVADYIHSKGLKFGIYNSAGQYTCLGQAGSLGYQEADAELYAQWGVDYLKYDNCYSTGTDSITRFKAMAQALDKVDRDIFFAICNWGQQGTTDWAHLIGHSWRTTADIRSSWDSIMYNLRENERLYNPHGQGPYIGWNDPDMLEVGNQGLTDDENLSHFILWVLVKAPLILGNDLRSLKKDSYIHWIISHSYLTGIHQDPLGDQARCVQNCDNYSQGLQIWRCRLSGEVETHAVAIINLGLKTVYAPIINYKAIGLQWQTWHISDLIHLISLGIRSYEYLMVEIRSHQTLLFKFVKANPGDCEMPYFNQFRSTSCPPKTCPLREAFFVKSCNK